MFVEVTDHHFVCWIGTKWWWVMWWWAMCYTVVMRLYLSSSGLVHCCLCWQWNCRVRFTWWHHSLVAAENRQRNLLFQCWCWCLLHHYEPRQGYHCCPGWQVWSQKADHVTGCAIQSQASSSGLKSRTHFRQSVENDWSLQHGKICIQFCKKSSSTRTFFGFLFFFCPFC